VFCAIVIFLSGCNKQYEEVPLAQFEQRQPFRAVVEKIYVEDFGELPSGVVVIIGLRTETGERIAIRGKRAGEDLVRFARSLQKGKAYEFPRAWVDYRLNGSNSRQ